MSTIRHRHALKLAAAATLTLIAAICAPALARAARPNIIVIQTDDQNAQSIKAKYRSPNGKLHKVMPTTAAKIFRQGTEFSNYYATAPVCSPSRASLLTGQYPHNDDLLANAGAQGGWQGFQALPLYHHNAPLALQRAGYRTSHFGKLINGYYDGAHNRVETKVPPGWTNWFSTAFLPGTKYYGYQVNDNGRAVGPFGNPNYQSHGPGIDSKKCTAALLLKRHQPKGFKCNYLTDVMTREALKEIRRKSGKPMFMQIDYQAPHLDHVSPEGPQPATRDLDKADRVRLPRRKNFNERNVSDKPRLVRRGMGKRLNREQIGRLTISYRRELESLMAVDDGVSAIIKTLKKTGQLSNTYIFYLSDHGYFMGAHRFGLGKFLAYQEASTVAMAVRGPGVRRGAKAPEVVGNIDIPATALKLARAKPGYKVDGRSLVPYWRHPNKRSRRPLEIMMGTPSGVNGPPKVVMPWQAMETWMETGAHAKKKPGQAPALRYRAYRIGPYKYVDYDAGGFELYDLRKDPFEMHNVIGNPAYRKVLAYMRKYFPEVVNCQGSQCRRPLPPWPSPG